MIVRSFVCDALDVRIYESRESAGAAGAVLAAEAVRRMIAERGQAPIILASAVSQDQFLASFRASEGIDWGKVIVFHMDEYAGMTAEHPASFRKFQKERVLDHVPVGTFHALRGEAEDLEAECRRYSSLLEEYRPELVIMGVGENGHLAFIDPPVCRFDEPAKVRVVELDDVCRMQQVHDGAFSCLEEVPKRALSLTVPLFLSIPQALVFVNGPRKAAAIQAALEGPIVEACPASALRRHPNATLFLDPGAAGQLSYR